jgi:hypothetical protein
MTIRIEQDFSKTACFLDCPRKYFISYVLKLTTEKQSPAPSFGSAVHSFLSRWYATQDLGYSMEAPSISGWIDQEGDDKHTRVRLMEILLNYTRTYPQEPWKLIANEVPIEQKLSIPESFRYELGKGLEYLSPNHDLTAEERIIAGELEFYLIGKVDLVVEMYGFLYGVDHKTTSQLGDKFFLRYKPDLQMFGYTWALREIYGPRVQGMWVNAISTAKTAGKAGSTVRAYARELISRTGSELDLYPSSMIPKLFDIWRREKAVAPNLPAEEGSAPSLLCADKSQRALVDFHFPPNETSCCNYGACQFRELCMHNLHPDYLSKLVANTWDPRSCLEE